MSNLKVIKLTRDANGNAIVTRDANGRVQVPTDARGWPLDDPWGEHPAGAHEYFPWQRAGLKEEDVCTIKPIADTEWRSDDDIYDAVEADMESTRCISAEEDAREERVVATTLVGRVRDRVDLRKSIQRSAKEYSSELDDMTGRIHDLYDRAAETPGARPEIRALDELLHRLIEVRVHLDLMEKHGHAGAY